MPRPDTPFTARRHCEYASVEVDAGGNIFTAVFDGLNRVKVITGPPIPVITSSDPSGSPSGPFVYATNFLVQATTYFYDAAGRVLTNVNALGETTFTRMDALGRVTTNVIYSSSGALVREQYTMYSADHNSVTVTDGSGAGAVSHTTWTDADGQVVLAIANPVDQCDGVYAEPI